MGVHLPGRPDTELAVVLYCLDLDRMARFWTAVLGYDRSQIVEPYCSLRPPDGAGVEVLLHRVSEPKAAGKNRLHLDLRVPDLDDEVARVTGLGARVLTTEPMVENGYVWHVLADPEGNEFCVLRPPA